MFHMVRQPLLLGLVTVSETSKDFYHPLYHLLTFLWVLSKQQIHREVCRSLKIKDCTSVNLFMQTANS